MLKIATAICMLVVLVESVPVFAAKHEIDQASVKADGGFPFKIVANASAVQAEDDPPCVLENNGIRP
ncbi:hypothetical protein H7849_16990 [Alloacidobacterium dinghuense]|uniref:Uncharacterized protein n=1 Tax=Alloacidobacterium dinghuense TaxID=2763107 RepID=A0A7G8BE34_9BACT|nr:hypothetical protein [Alloacidobacterium dinghuense]QNI30804.1 hypothetical protein H7849_16990 [Alloacidobacterium dinghuense]